MLRSDKQPRLPAALARQKAGMSILVIDDDPEIRSSVGMFLQAQGHMVYEPVDGFVGVKVLRREVVDIVITDVEMPGMDGFEVLREVKRLSPDTEVIVVTAFSEVEHAFRAMRDGAFDFFCEAVQGGGAERLFAADHALPGASSGEEQDAGASGSHQRGVQAALWSGGGCGGESGHLRGAGADPAGLPVCGYHGAHLRRDGYGQGAGGQGKRTGGGNVRLSAFKKHPRGAKKKPPKSSEGCAATGLVTSSRKGVSCYQRTRDMGVT